MQVDFCDGLQWSEQVWLFAFFELLDGFGEHFVVKLKANFKHVTALVFAQHFACAAYFKVVHGQIKAAAEFFHLLNGIKPLGGVFAQAFYIGHHQVGVGLVVAAAYAPA